MRAGVIIYGTQEVGDGDLANSSFTRCVFSLSREKKRGFEAARVARGVLGGQGTSGATDSNVSAYVSFSFASLRNSSFLVGSGKRRLLTLYSNKQSSEKKLPILNTLHRATLSARESRRCLYPMPSSTNLISLVAQL